MKPAVSVIMPVRNSAQYVYFAVESILKQSFGDFEFIIIDDASDDHTRQILNEINDNRIIRINNEKHTGNYKCRNQGLSIATGKYIAVMDADDIACSNRFSKQYDFMESNLEFMATGSDILFFNDTFTSLFQRIRDFDELKVNLLKDNVCSHPSLMFRNDIIKLHRIWYNEDYYYSSDYDLIQRISQVGKITNLPEPLLHYRLHNKQISTLKKAEQVMYADYIRLKQLSLLKLRPSTDEMMIHLSLMKDLPIPESKIILAEEWCNKLLSKNHKLNIYNELHLYRFLEERLNNELLIQRRH